MSELHRQEEPKLGLGRDVVTYWDRQLGLICFGVWVTRVSCNGYRNALWNRIGIMTTATVTGPRLDPESRHLRTEYRVINSALCVGQTPAISWLFSWPAHV